VQRRIARILIYTRNHDLLSAEFSYFKRARVKNNTIPTHKGVTNVILLRS